MKAMVLAAGIGSRLKEFTKDTPKCLVPLGDGTTMLDRIIENLKGSGVEEIIINLHYLGKKIEDYVKKKNNYSIRIEFSREEELLGTGGGLKKAAWFFNTKEPFILHNSDVYTDLDLKLLYEEHIKGTSIATLAVMKRPTNRPLLFDSKKCLVGWEAGGNASIVSSNAVDMKVGFSGIQVLDKEIFSYMDSLEGDFSIITVYLRAIHDERFVKAFDMKGSFWIDMGEPEKLKELKEKLSKNKKS